MVSDAAKARLAAKKAKKDGKLHGSTKPSPAVSESPVRFTQCPPRVRSQHSSVQYCTCLLALCTMHASHRYFTSTSVYPEVTGAAAALTGRESIMRCQMPTFGALCCRAERGQPERPEWSREWNSSAGPGRWPQEVHPGLAARSDRSLDFASHQPRHQDRWWTCPAGNVMYQQCMLSLTLAVDGTENER